MSSHDEEEDDIYQVPRSSNEIYLPDNPPVLEEAPPPALMPKKGSGFKRASSLLDRHTPNSNPHAPPRHFSFNRNSSVDTLESSAETRAEILNLRHASQAGLSKSLDLTETPARQTGETPLSTLSSATATKDQPTVSQQSASSSVKNGEKPIQSANPLPRPVPRPRTKGPTPVPNKVSNQNLRISSPSAGSGLQDRTSVIKKEALSELPLETTNKIEVSLASIDFSLPPDADSIESMLNDEFDKKYGLQNKDPDPNVALCGNSKPATNTNAENNFIVAEEEYVDVGTCMKNMSLLSEVSAAPKPHTAASIPSYFPMINKVQQEKASSGLPPLLPGPSQISPLPKGLLTIDLGTDLFTESTSDDVAVSDKVSSKGHGVIPTPSLATPKPFNDIQPFISKIEKPPDAADRTIQQDKRVSLDFSYFDPLWSGKQKSDQKSESNLVGKSNSANVSLSSDFDVDWSCLLTDSVPKTTDSLTSTYVTVTTDTLTSTYVTVTTDTLTSTYDTAEDIDYSSDAYYSQIGKETNNSITSPWKSQTSRQSFHHAAPVAPPPPFPRQQNRLPEPKPPPVPPRPDVIQPQSHSVSSSLALASSSPSPATTDIFQNLPTPVFTPNQNNDPFQNSKFDYECLKFNNSQVPAPPSRSPLPKTPSVKAGATSNEVSSAAAAIDPRMDPERISRFVIPPPGSRDNALNNEDYDLARELSSSDSESTDTPILDNSMQGWPTAGVPVTTPLKVFDGTLLPKKTSRYGYLYKQGGYKANKGWKKRWVVFNSTSLSYYSNNTSQVSKRIIPVRCMVSVETDVKEKDKNSFKFKVITSLKDRVFIFSAETLDDCITWANILMAAITEYKRSFSSGEEVPPDKTDKEGFIKFSNLKKYYVTITGKTLCYYRSFEDFQMGSPTHEIDMKLCSVKEKDHKKLQLWIHYGHFDLTFESDQEMQQWRMAMEDAIAEGLADDTVLNKVYENLSNQTCADCNAENPHWASINLGIVVCKSCAGVHRMFDYRISKIRSLRMDTRVWTPSLIEIMVTIGNANANAFWEAELPDGTKINAKDSMEKRKEYITKKYKGKKFCSLHPLANCGAALGEALLSAASNDNILEVMKILFSGADVLFRKEDHGPTAYDIAKEHGQRLIMALLYQNGGDPQSLEQDVKDENRLREDIRLQGFLNKTGPIGKTFEKRWCILEHGALTYYINDKSKTFKGSIDRKNMYMIQTVATERLCYTFELSTGLKDNRVFTFSSENKDESGEWIRTIAKLMAPVAVMDHVGMIDIKLAGLAYMKESLVDEWRQTFIVFTWRGINYMNRDLKFDYIDLRKASSIKMQDTNSGYQQSGQCFVISSTGKSIYLQAKLSRDTERMYTAFLEASMSSGPTLNDQALTNENVPVIVERCITHIHMNGLEEKGIYRTAGQNSKVQALLEDFRKDAWSVSLSEYTVQDVSNVLKRFLRELENSVFERINYASWINMAGCQDKNNRLMWYKYYLEKMPLVNYQTLKRIILHLVRVSQSQEVNLMSVTNLASCFAPSLMRTANDEQPSLTSEASRKEIGIVVDLMSNSDYFFSANDNERVIMNNIKKAEQEIQKMNQDKLKSVVESPAGILTPVHLLCLEGQSVNILVTEHKTAREALDDLKRNKAVSDLSVSSLSELLFRGSLERPLFPEDLVAMTTKRWAEWEKWVMEDNSVCLCAQSSELLETLHRNFNANHVLLSKLHYCDSKPKSSKFKRKMLGFRQCKLAVYSDSQGSSESASWKVEDITIYLGTMHKKPPPPTRYCLTFTVNGEKYTKPPFGHCISFDTEDELYRWASAMYTAQHPAGLLSWTNK